ncbi:MAG: methyltransferase domain-containing protein [bacterium]
MSLSETIIRHWEHRAELDYIRRDLERRGIRPGQVTVADLAAYDQLHSGQLDATQTLADWIGVDRGSRVLDLGSGLGGAARYLATTHDCRVTAVELSPELHSTGAELTRWTRLEDRVTHRCGDILELDLDASFELLWIQHVDMHVRDKAQLYRCCRALLAPGGRVAWQDWLAGPGGEPRWPVPWSRDGDISFLISEAEFRVALAGAGLTVWRLENVTEKTRYWYERVRKRLSRTLDRLGSEDHARARRQRFTGLLEEVENVLQNLDEGRLDPVFCEAAASQG